MNRGKPEKGLPLGNYKNALAKSRARNQETVSEIFIRLN